MKKNSRLEQMDFLDVRWFNPPQFKKQILGVVFCRDNITNKINTYLGLVDGKDENKNLAQIVAWGAKGNDFLRECALNLIEKEITDLE